MNPISINKDNLRLDQVVYEYYGHLNMFDAVLSVNSHITTPILAQGVTLLMPETAIAIEEDKLW